MSEPGLESLSANTLSAHSPLQVGKPTRAQRSQGNDGVTERVRGRGSLELGVLTPRPAGMGSVRGLRLEVAGTAQALHCDHT